MVAAKDRWPLNRGDHLSRFNCNFKINRKGTSVLRLFISSEIIFILALQLNCVRLT